MTHKKSVNLTVIYGRTTRKLALIIAAVSGLLWIFSLWDLNVLVPETLSLWIFIAAIFTANFSETGSDQNQNMLRRYLAFKSSLCAFIGFILVVSFIEIVFAKTIQLPSLYLAGGLNLAILLLEWILRWSFAEIDLDESVSHLFKNQPGLLWLLFILTFATLIGMIFFV